MDRLIAVEKLARKARQEAVPDFDVTLTVVQQIQAQPEESFSFLPFDLFAGVSVAIASITMVFSVAAWQYLANPMTDLLAPLQEVPLW